MLYSKLMGIGLMPTYSLCFHPGLGRKGGEQQLFGEVWLVVTAEAQKDKPNSVRNFESLLRFANVSSA